MQRDQAVFFEKISTQERFYSNYFRVVYHGENFDAAIRCVGACAAGGAVHGVCSDQEFIYRGVRLEPVMYFTNRSQLAAAEARLFAGAFACAVGDAVKMKFPDAEIFMSSDAPSEERMAACKSKRVKCLAAAAATLARRSSPSPR